MQSTLRIQRRILRPPPPKLRLQSDRKLRRDAGPRQHDRVSCPYVLPSPRVTQLIKVDLTHATLNFAENRGKAPLLMGMIDEKLDAGVDVTLDTYPYLPGCTTLAALIPSWASSGGPAETLKRLEDPETRERIRVAVEQTGCDGGHGIPTNWDEIQVRFCVLASLDLRIFGLLSPLLLKHPLVPRLARFTHSVSCLPDACPVYTLAVLFACFVRRFTCFTPYIHRVLHVYSCLCFACCVSSLYPCRTLYTCFVCSFAHLFPCIHSLLRVLFFSFLVLAPLVGRILYDIVYPICCSPFGLYRRGFKSSYLLYFMAALFFPPYCLRLLSHFSAPFAISALNRTPGHLFTYVYSLLL